MAVPFAILGLFRLKDTFIHPQSLPSARKGFCNASSIALLLETDERTSF